MDADRFDALTRALTGAEFSRRRLLMGVAGSTLAAVAVALGVAEADAIHYGCRHVGKPCRRNDQCCSSLCRGPQGRKTCRTHNVGTCTVAKDFCRTGTFGCGEDACFCFRTTGGANFCSTGGGSCMACTRDAQCEIALATRGAACVDNSHGNCTSCSEGTGCAFPCAP